MGRRIRAWQPNVVYSSTARCNDRQFLLKPDHNTKHPLLAAECPPNALDVRNRHIPQPSVINIIGAAIARALVRTDFNVDRSGNPFDAIQCG